MSISFTPLGSGSKGNSILVSNEKHKFLIDCGLCFSELKNRLFSIDVKIEDLEGVVITHEHIDHIKSAKILSRRCEIPVYARYETMPKLVEILGCFEGICYEQGEILTVGDMEITSFSTPHDAVAPVGYMITDKDSKAVYATDLGCVTSELINVSNGAGLVMIESNYDPEMLKSGPYPAFLKTRIGSDYGHLSNYACADAVLEMLNKGTNKFILGHLSENNNTRQKTGETLLSVLKKSGAELGTDYYAKIAWQHKVTESVSTATV
ncbi:MAG: putative metallo-hydrolase YycJ [Firmicutes bacterium ADurb.Bin080]|jgi:phosphoribosyl 1,2-cyclic phosphodiesterase|nr:MBL fold metallo-hydrolase [Clostridiales bacterium]OQC15198.1 MAG: putative metallo-hydrolase YycJ [Firmicutes bacterium ADurb.Bin080]